MLIKFFVFMLLALPALAEEYVNLAAQGYKNELVDQDDFHKFITNSYRGFIWLEQRNNFLYEFFDNEKFEGKPEFVYFKGTLKHRDKVVCDTKNGIPVREMKNRPKNLTPRQDLMAECIYLPFVLYRNSYFSLGTSSWNSESNFGMRVISSRSGRRAIEWNNKTYYLSGDTMGIDPQSPLQEVEDTKKCTEEVRKDYRIKQLEIDIDQCLKKNDFECFFKHAYVYIDPSDDAKISARYGDLSLESRFFFNLDDVSFFKEDYFVAPYKKMIEEYNAKVKEKYSIDAVFKYKKLLKKRILIDNLSKLYAVRDELVPECENKANQGLYYGFIGRMKNFEESISFLIRDGKAYLVYNVYKR